MNFIQKLLKKEQQSQRVLFDMFYHRVYNTAYCITQDHYTAQDVVQETFIKAFKKLDTLKDGSKMGAWLGAIASKTALDFLRKKNKWNDMAAEDVIIEMEISNQQLAASVDEIVENRFTAELVRQSMVEMKPEYRQVLILKYEYDMKYEEIADVLGVSAGTVKSRIFRAKEKLRALLNGRLKEEGRTDHAASHKP